MTREEAVAALTERMAEAWRKASNDYAGDDNECMDALSAQAALEVVLSARVETPCDTCYGTGWVPLDPRGASNDGCPDCQEEGLVEGSGKSYGSLLVTVATMEQVGWARERNGGPFPHLFPQNLGLYSELSPPKHESLLPVYVQGLK